MGTNVEFEPCPENRSSDSELRPPFNTSYKERQILGEDEQLIFWIKHDGERRYVWQTGMPSPSQIVSSEKPPRTSGIIYKPR